jgi:hypothetical protein
MRVLDLGAPGKRSRTTAGRWPVLTELQSQVSVDHRQISEDAKLRFSGPGGADEIMEETIGKTMGL